jgi:hypothetical protein
MSGTATIRVPVTRLLQRSRGNGTTLSNSMIKPVPLLLRIGVFVGLHIGVLAGVWALI